MGRVVTMVTKTPPDRFLEVGWPWLLGMAVVVLIVRPAVTLTRYLITNQAHRRAVHRADPLAVALARGAPELGVLSERFCRENLQPRDADRSVGALDADRDHHHRLVHYSVRRLRHRLDGGSGPLARRADPALVLQLRRAAVLFRAAHARALEGEFHRALDADGAHRRQLHQHSHGEAFRPRQRRGSICAQRGRPPYRSVLRRAAPAHRFRHHSRRAQCAVDRRIGRAGAGAVALRQGRGRRHRHGAAADAAAHQHVAPDRHAHHRNIRRYRRGAGGHAHHRAAAATARSRRCAGR